MCKLKHLLCASWVFFFLKVNWPKNPNFNTRMLYEHQNSPKSSHQSCFQYAHRSAPSFTAISPLYKLIWPLHVRIRGNWAESVSTLLKNGAIVRSLGDTGTKMAPSLCWDFKLSNEGSFVEIGQEMTKLGWKVWKKSLQSLRAESIAVCMQRWSFRRRSLSWKTSFDWSEMKVCALPVVSPHPAVRTWPGF